jgi:hypothetical protein
VETAAATEMLGRKQWENSAGNLSARHGPGSHLSFQKAVDEPSPMETLVIAR